MSRHLIVSRHAGAVEWLRLQGINGEIVSQVSSPEQVRGRVVVGNLPLHLAAECEAVVAIDLPGLLPEQRGKDLSPAEMDAAGAALSRYVVQRLPTTGPTPPEGYTAKGYDAVSESSGPGLYTLEQATTDWLEDHESRQLTAYAYGPQDEYGEAQHILMCAWDRWADGWHWSPWQEC